MAKENTFEVKFSKESLVILQRLAKLNKEAKLSSSKDAKGNLFVFPKSSGNGTFLQVVYLGLVRQCARIVEEFEESVVITDFQSFVDLLQDSERVTFGPLYITIYKKNAKIKLVRGIDLEDKKTRLIDDFKDFEADHGARLSATFLLTSEDISNISSVTGKLGLKHVLLQKENDELKAVALDVSSEVSNNYSLTLPAEYLYISEEFEKRTSLTNENKKRWKEFVGLYVDVEHFTRRIDPKLSYVVKVWDLQDDDEVTGPVFALELVSEDDTVRYYLSTEFLANTGA